MAFEPDYKNIILASLDYYIKSPQAWWLKTTEVYSVIVLESRVPNQGALRATHPAEAGGESVPHLLFVVGSP